MEKPGYHAALEAPVAELVDAADSKSVVRKDVGVRVSLGAPKHLYFPPGLRRPLTPPRKQQPNDLIKTGRHLGMLPQQRLLIELLSMSGDIAVPRDGKDSIFWRTLNECAQKKLITLQDINDSICRVSVTIVGRASLKTPA